MDDSSDQTQTTTEPTQSPTVPPTDQPPVETPPAQPTPENPVVSETPNIPNPPNSPNPEPVVPATPEPQPTETPQSTQSQTTAPSETPTQPDQPQPVVPPVETQTPTPQPVIDIPALHYPFSGNFAVTFAFGQQSDNEDIIKKFQEWGIVGHNGLDFGLSAGNEVFACDVGKVIQSGDNGDFGTSITIQHSWGQSLYAHLSETKVKVDDEIQPNKVIGFSGSSGSAFGEHLHFAIKPNNPDSNNGYLGFIDPSPYLSLPSQKEEPKQETPPIQTPPENSQPQPVQEQPKPEEVPPPIKLEPEKPADQSKETAQPQQPETPLPAEADAKAGQPSPEEIQKQVDEKLKVELNARRQKANQARLQKKENNLKRIFELVQTKRVVSNEKVRDFLHVSQSTATNYLTEMVNRGMLKKEGERSGAKYSV